MSNKRCYEDLFNLFCGEKLGGGIDRTVYACRTSPDLVVKVEPSYQRYFANVLEMKFWNDHEYYKPVAQWLAPCEFLSPDGRILLQKRVDPLPIGYKLPEKVPSFLTDLKRENFGLLDGRMVSFDYSRHIPSPSIRLKKAGW